MKARQWAYSNNWLKSHQVSKPVVSIGNLTMGGTGKTPIVDYLISGLLKRGIKVAIISRGYGGKYSGCVKLPPNADPQVYGDEPVLLHNHHPDVPIYLCKDRFKAAEMAIANENVDIILMDDGFQHLSLKRNLDIVLIDLTESKSNYRVLPFGRGREGLKALKRAHIVVFSKGNFLEQETRTNRINFFKSFFSPLTISFESQYFWDEVLDIQSHEKSKIKGPVSLLSGIGNPKSFENLVESQSIQIMSHIVKPDHFNYSLDFLKSFENDLKNKNIFTVLTTEKDGVKIRPLLSKLTKKSEINWLFLRIKIGIQGEQELYEKLVRLTS
jgi:tetraacyldisaccharide 4'-kinase